jgi:hypothetical protein
MTAYKMIMMIDILSRFWASSSTTNINTGNAQNHGWLVIDGCIQKSRVNPATETGLGT